MKKIIGISLANTALFPIGDLALLVPYPKSVYYRMQVLIGLNMIPN